MKGIFKEGDFILLVYDKKRQWMKKLEDKDFHCNYGHIQLMDIVGKPYGYKAVTNTGKYLKCLPPTLIDWFEQGFEHGSQIIYAKDAAMITLLLDLKPGDVVYEAGTGSGALTSVLSRAVGETGIVITHEVRESAYKTAQRNHKKIGTNNVHFILTDIVEKGFTREINGVPVTADAMILDMGDPWLAIDNALEVLRPGARLVIFTPSFQQLEKITIKLSEHKFRDITAIELLEREIQLKLNAMRPATRMIGHTGFLLHATWIPEFDVRNK